MAKVKIAIPGILKHLFQGKIPLEIEASNVEEVVEFIKLSMPELYAKIYDEQGNLKKYLYIYVNGKESGSGEDRKKELSDGDEVVFLMAIAGG